MKVGVSSDWKLLLSSSTSSRAYRTLNWSIPTYTQNITWTTMLCNHLHFNSGKFIFVFLIVPWATFPWPATSVREPALQMVFHSDSASPCWSFALLSLFLLMCIFLAFFFQQILIQQRPRQQHLYVGQIKFPRCSSNTSPTLFSLLLNMMYLRLKCDFFFFEEEMNVFSYFTNYNVIYEAESLASSSTACKCRWIIIRLTCFRN